MKKVLLSLLLCLGLVSVARAADAYYISGAFTDFENVAMTNVDGKFTYTAPVSKYGFNIYDGEDYFTATCYGSADRDAVIKLNTPFPVAESFNMINFASDITLKEVLVTFDPATMTVVITDPAGPAIPKYYIAGQFNGTDFSKAPEMTYDEGKYTYTLDAKGGDGLLILSEPSWSATCYGAKEPGALILLDEPVAMAQSSNMMYFPANMQTVNGALVTFDPEAMTLLVTDPNAPVVPEKPTDFFIYGGFNDWNIAKAPQMKNYGQYKTFTINSLPNTGFKIAGQRSLDIPSWIFGAAADNDVELGVPKFVVAGEDGKNFALAADIVSVANARVNFDPEEMTVTVTGYPVTANEPVPENLFVYGNLKGFDYKPENAIKGVKRGNTFTFSGIELDCSYRETGLFAFIPMQSADRDGEVAGRQYGPKDEMTPIALDTPAAFGRNGYTFFEVPNGCYKMVVDFDTYTVTVSKANVVDPDQKYYIWGSFNEQNVAEAPEMKFENGVYTYKLGKMTGDTGFMISNENSTVATQNFGVDDHRKAELDTPLQTVNGAASADRFIYLNIPAGGEAFENALVTFDSSDYTVTISEYVPEPTYYVVGIFNNWDIANAPEMTRNDDGTYTLSIDKMLNQFKIVGERAWVDSKTIGAKVPYSIKLNVPNGAAVGGAEFGFADDITSVDDAVITFNPDNMTIMVDGVAVKDQPDLYLRGSFNGWVANDDTKMTYDANTHTYTLGEVEVAENNEFKIASADYDINFGGVDFTAESLRALLTATVGNCSLTVPQAAKYDFSFSYITKLLTITKSKVGIDTIDADAVDGEAEVYTLQGRRVYGTPAAGIYVVIRNGKASKIAVR